jgi:NADH dehydrogenase
MGAGSSKHRVVIIGGGFGGLYTAKALKNVDVDVTLIDRRNFHLFQPLLYQVATGGLSPGDISSPLRGVLNRNKNTRVWLAEVTDIDVDNKLVYLGEETVPYDSLVVATGSGHSYFGHDEWEKIAPGLKTIEDAIEIRKRILFAFEAAERAETPREVREWLNFVIVGAGPTGVELAGAVGEICHHIIPHDFRAIDPRKARILLVEGADRVLPSYPQSLSLRALQSLANLGVETELNARVVNVTDRSVTIDSGESKEEVRTRTVLWAAGVKTSPLGRMLTRDNPEQLDRAGRVMVDERLGLPGHPEVFIIGDLANFSHQTGEPLPGLAPVAMQEGKYVAKLIRRRLKGDAGSPFSYFDKGSLATIGRAAAVGTFGKIKVSGWFAWMAWLFIHLMYLAEFDNRLLVLTQWAWNYITKNRGARLIAPETLPSGSVDRPLEEVTKEPEEKDREKQESPSDSH